MKRRYFVNGKSFPITFISATLVFAGNIAHAAPGDPVITAPASMSVAENTTAGLQFTSDINVTWTLSSAAGGDANDVTFLQLTDSQLKSVNVAFIAAPNFESPQDNGSNNTYKFKLKGVSTADSKKSFETTYTLTVTDVDDVAPTITGSSSISVNENTNVSTILQDYNANESATWNLEGTDASSFSISAAGELRLLSAADYETKSSYAVTVTATDTALNKATLSVAVTVTDVDEVAPTILCADADCGGLVAIDLPENASGNVIYSFDADKPVTWSIENCTAELCALGDKNLFSINSSGDLTMNSVEFDPTPGPGEGNDNSYSIAVIATSSSGISASLEFNVNITEVDNVTPIVIGSSSISILEDFDISNSLDTYSANESVTWSLEGEDASSFSINSLGELRLVASADFEAKSRYSITVIANDAAFNPASINVVVSILDVNESSGGGNDDKSEPSEDVKKEIESRLLKEVNDKHSLIKATLLNEIANSGVKNFGNPENLIYLSIPGLTSENVLKVHQLFVAAKQGDSVESFIAFAKKYSVVSRLASLGLSKGVTLRELEVLGLVSANSSADASLLRALRAVPLADRDTVEELEKAIAAILSSR